METDVERTDDFAVSLGDDVGVRALLDEGVPLDGAEVAVDAAVDVLVAVFEEVDVEVSL